VTAAAPADSANCRRVKCHLAGKATYGDRIAVRARLASLGLVMTLGFLLLVLQDVIMRKKREVEGCRSVIFEN
jgi:hypothetical protein